MSHYNPRVYNYSNLKKEDKRIVESNIDLVDSIENMKYDFDTDQNTATLEKIFNETAVFTIEQVIQHIGNEIVEFIISRIDNYDEEIEEIDTDNYLYGLDKDYE